MTRILQITDTHIVTPGELALGVVDTAAGMERAVETVNRLLPQIGPLDCAVFTGDLTDLATPDAYAQFVRIADQLPVPWLAVPGNHDARAPMRAAFAGADWLPSEGPIHWSRICEGLTLVGLDTLIEGAHHGELAPEGLEFLAATLAANRGRPALIAMHHPPIRCGIEAMDMDNLRNAEALRPILEEHDAELRLICGHVHREVTGLFAGRVCRIVGAPSHSVLLDMREGAFHGAMLEPGTMSLHELEGQGLISHSIPVGRFKGPFPFA